MPWSWLSGFRLRRPARRPAVPGIPSPRQFRRLLDQEVARAARNHHAVALLAFEVEAVGPALPQVVKLIKTRVRGTDALGWLGPKQLGVLLRHVETAEALQVAAQLCNQLERRTYSTPCTVYPYPPLSSPTSPERRPGQPTSRRAYASSGASLEARAEPALE